MRASKLDRRITIQRAEISKDDFNNDVYGPWSDFVRVYASREELRDAERVSSMEVNAHIDTRFQVRWTSKISEVTPGKEFQLICEGRTYRITGIKELGRRVGREISATTRLDKV